MTEDDLIIIVIQCVDEKSVSLEVPGDLLISQLKLLVEEELGVSPENQRFIFRGDALQDDRSLQDYNIQSRDTIHLAIKNLELNNYEISTAPSLSSNLSNGRLHNFTPSRINPSDQQNTNFITTAAGLLPSAADSLTSPIINVAVQAIGQLNSSSNAILNNSNFSFSGNSFASSDVAPRSSSSEFFSGIGSSLAPTDSSDSSPSSNSSVSQRIGPFVMGEYNGVPVAVVGALVGGAPVNQGGVSATMSVSPNGLWSNTGFLRPSSNNDENGNTIQTNLASATQTSNFSAGESNRHTNLTGDTQRPENNYNLGTLLSNLVQQISPAIASMTTNVVSRHASNIENLNERRESNNQFVTSNSSRSVTGGSQPLNSRDGVRESRIGQQGYQDFMQSIVDVLNGSSRGLIAANETISRLSQNHTTIEEIASESTNRQQLWISNDDVNEKLPWNQLVQLLNILESETGWVHLHMELPPNPSMMPYGPGPLSIFLTVYVQVSNILQNVLLQLQAWQEGLTRLDVPRFGHMAQMVALMSEIHAQLSNLLCWMLQCMVNHVDANSLNRTHVEGNRVVNNDVNMNVDHVTESNEIISDENNDDKSLTGINTVDDHKIEGEPSRSENNLDNESLSPEVSMKKSKDCEFSVDTAIHCEGDHIENRIDSGSNSYKDNKDDILNSIPSHVRERFERWTSDPVRFSKKILKDAQSRPFSVAYASGDSNLSGNSKSTIRSPDIFFSLNWHRSMSRINEVEEHEIPSALSNAYVGNVLSQLSERAARNSDYLSNPSRFPGITKILAFFGELSKNDK